MEDTLTSCKHYKVTVDFTGSKRKTFDVTAHEFHKTGLISLTLPDGDTLYVPLTGVESILVKSQQ